MSKFYIINECFDPNTAVTNRELSLVKGFSKLGIQSTMVFVMPSLNADRLNTRIDRVEVKYLWKMIFSKNKILKHFYRPLSLRLFYKQLKKNDIVLLIGSPHMLKDVQRKCDNVYQERTEHPDVVAWLDGLTPEVYYSECIKVKGTFVISESLRQHFLDKGCGNGKVHIINAVVDPERFVGIEKCQSKEKYIAYCGKATNNKDGVDELIKSFAIVSKKYPEYKLYIIGKAPSGNDESGNVKLVNSLGISDKVQFTGVVNSTQIPQILTDAEILALDRPDSLQAQCGFPTKLGEYLLTANPVVVTRVGDIPKFLKNYETALLAEERSPEDFANKLLWVIEHPDEAKVIGKKGKQVALNNFNSDIEAKKIAEIIFYDECRKNDNEK